MRKCAVLLASILSVCMILLGIPADALSGNNRLILHYYAVNEALPLANAAFHIYRIGDPDGRGGYTLTKGFDEYKVDISDLDWNEAGRLTMLAITLSAYAERDDIVPLKTGRTDARGDLTFTGLDDGLYLVCGDTLTVDAGYQEWNYTAQPLLLPLPYPDGTAEGLQEMEVDVKYDRFPPPTMDDLVDLTVCKVWDGEDAHPDSITAQLMRNGIITDSAVLNEANHWQHTWKNLNSGYVWQITEEDVPDGYYVSVHQEGYFFTIINKEFDTQKETNVPTEPSTKDPPETETLPLETADHPPVTDLQEETTPDPPEETDKRTNQTTDDSSSGTTVTTTTSSSSSDGDTRLPQTGQLWWPVPLLAGGGLILIGLGILHNKDAD